MLCWKKRAEDTCGIARTSSLLAVVFGFWEAEEAASWLVLLGEGISCVGLGGEGWEGTGDVQAGIALADYALCLGELAGAFLDAHGGLRLLVRDV